MAIGKQHTEDLRIPSHGSDRSDGSYDSSVSDIARSVWAKQSSSGNDGAQQSALNNNDKLVGARILPSVTIDLTGSQQQDSELPFQQVASADGIAGSGLSFGKRKKSGESQTGRDNPNLVGGSGDSSAQQLRNLFPNGRPVEYPATLEEYSASHGSGVSALKQRIKEDCKTKGYSHSVGHSQGAHVISTAFRDLANSRETAGCKMSAVVAGEPDGEDGILSRIRKVAPELVPPHDPRALSKNQRITRVNHLNDPVFRAQDDPFQAMENLTHHFLDSYGNELVDAVGRYLGKKRK